MAAGQAVPLAAPVQPLGAASPASPPGPLSCAVPGTGCGDGEPHTTLEPWVPAPVSGCSVRSVGFAWAQGCCERLGGCLGAADSRLWGRWEKRRLVGVLVDAQGKPCWHPPSWQPNRIPTLPTDGAAILTSPWAGIWHGGCWQRGGLLGDTGKGFSASPRCCCLRFPVMLLPCGMRIRFPAAPSPPSSRSLGDAAVPGRGHPEGSGGTRRQGSAPPNPR